jgi:D-serine deaminase-like pyridoxal phosphate-dependent protein
MPVLSERSWRPHVGDQVRLLPDPLCVTVHNFDAMMSVDPDGCVESPAVYARGRGSTPPTTS